MPEDGGRSLPDVLLVVIVVCVILFVGISMLSQTLDYSIGQSDDGTEHQTAAELDESGGWHALAQGTTGVDETVWNSRGYAVNLSGASDSYVQSDSNVDIATDSTWTVATWARVDSDATATEMTAFSVDGRVVISYNDTASEWRAWYYDDGSRDSYEVAVAAPNQPGTFAHVAAVSNGSHLTLYRNNTAGGTVNITAGNTVTGPAGSDTWNGRLSATDLTVG